MKRMMERGITDDEVRSYSDDARVMFSQQNEQRRLYLNAGVACVTHRRDDEWIYRTAWTNEDFDENIEIIMEVLNDAGL